MLPPVDDTAGHRCDVNTDAAGAETADADSTPEADTASFPPCSATDDGLVLSWMYCCSAVWLADEGWRRKTELRVDENDEENRLCYCG